MSTRNLSLLSTPVLALAIALVGAGCSSDPTTTDAQDRSTVSTSSTATGTNGENGAAASTTATAQNGSDAAIMESNEVHITGTAPGTPVYDERYAASKDIRGYRGLLMAELEAIRVRLNDGTRPAEATKKDQDRAADLAQGLERMDRLIKAVEESDDLAWTSIRESQLKEAGEVRVWAADHGYKLRS